VQQHAVPRAAAGAAERLAVLKQAEHVALDDAHDVLRQHDPLARRGRHVVELDRERLAPAPAPLPPAPPPPPASTPSGFSTEMTSPR
jgi:hypothetical protein